MKQNWYERLNAWVEGDLPEETWEDTRPEPLEELPHPIHHRLLGRLYEKFNRPNSRIQRYLFRAMCVILCLFFTGVMLYTVAQLPLIGRENGPTDNELSHRYIEQGVEEVGATNLVSNMILVYRGFDTFGESCVLFLAATCVIILLEKDRNNCSEEDERVLREDEQIDREESSLLLRRIVNLLMPMTLLFGFYVLLNGHLSPGGGFAGGSIIGGSVILCDTAFGREKVARFFNHHIYHIIKIGALILYAVLILYTILVGANGIESLIGLGIPGQILSAGIIMPINVAVGLEVACTMYAFYAFFSKGEL